MKILFIEADNGLDNDQEKFAKGLQNLGHEVKVVCECYSDESKRMLHMLLKMNVFDAIFVQTTFTFDNRFKEFEPLYGLISHPVELWYAGHSSVVQLAKHIPEQYKHWFTYYDIWMHAFEMHPDNTDETFMWKRLKNITE